MTTPLIDELEGLFHIREQSTLIKQHLARIGEIITVESNTTLFSPEINDNSIYYLISGEIRIDSADHSKLIKSGTAKANFPLSEHRPHQATAITTKPCDLLKLPWETLYNLKKTAVHTNTNTRNNLQLEADEFIMKFHDEMKNGKLDLPIMPDLATRIIKATDNPDTLSSDIASIIQLDPSLTARLIQVVNSPAYIGLNPIDNCPDAVTRLGRIATRNLVVSFTLKNIFKSPSQVLKKRMSGLWKHSCNVASICHVLAQITPGLQPDNAMLSGIIHDIGTIPILSAARSHPKLMENPALLDQTIDKLRGEIGAMTLKQWGFSKEYVDVVLHAEDWLDDRFTKATYTDLVLVSQLHTFVGKPRMNELPRIDLIPAFHKLMLGELTPEFSLKVLELAKRDIAALGQLLRG
jgi:HD-like signal output (HDOD) protein